MQPSQEQIDQIKVTYVELEKSKGIAQKGGKLEWVKTDAKKHAHKGDLESYIKQKHKIDSNIYVDQNDNFYSTRSGKIN